MHDFVIHRNITVITGDSGSGKTVLIDLIRVLKLPKMESSIRKAFLPKSVAEILVEWKKDQDKIKETLGDEVQKTKRTLVHQRNPWYN